MFKLRTGFAGKCAVALLFWTSALVIAAPDCTTNCRNWKHWGDAVDLGTCWGLGTSQLDILNHCIDKGEISAGVAEEECKPVPGADFPKYWYKGCVDECTGGDVFATRAKIPGEFTMKMGEGTLQRCKTKLKDEEIGL